MLLYNNITFSIHQGTWNSWGRGTITLLVEPRAGTSPEIPLWHIPGTLDCLNIPLPFTRNGTGSLFINVTTSVGWLYTFMFNTSSLGAEELSRVWNGTGWTQFQYDPKTNQYWASIIAETDTVMIAIKTNTDAILYCFWSFLE